MATYSGYNIMTFDVRGDDSSKGTCSYQNILKHIEKAIPDLIFVQGCSSPVKLGEFLSSKAVVDQLYPARYAMWQGVEDSAGYSACFIFNVQTLNMERFNVNPIYEKLVYMNDVSEEAEFRTRLYVRKCSSKRGQALNLLVASYQGFENGKVEDKKAILKQLLRYTDRISQMTKLPILIAGNFHIEYCTARIVIDTWGHGFNSYVYSEDSVYRFFRARTHFLVYNGNEQDLNNLEVQRLSEDSNDLSHHLPIIGLLDQSVGTDEWTLMTMNVNTRHLKDNRGKAIKNLIDRMPPDVLVIHKCDTSATLAKDFDMHAKAKGKACCLFNINKLIFDDANLTSDGVELQTDQAIDKNGIVESRSNQVAKDGNTHHVEKQGDTKRLAKEHYWREVVERLNLQRCTIHNSDKVFMIASFDGYVDNHEKGLRLFKEMVAIVKLVSETYRLPVLVGGYSHSDPDTLERSVLGTGVQLFQHTESRGTTRNETNYFLLCNNGDIEIKADLHDLSDHEWPVKCCEIMGDEPVRIRIKAKRVAEKKQIEPVQFAPSDKAKCESPSFTTNEENHFSTHVHPTQIFGRSALYCAYITGNESVFDKGTQLSTITGFGRPGTSFSSKPSANTASSTSTTLGSQPFTNTCFGSTTAIELKSSPGSTIKFKPPPGNDTMLVNDISTSISTDHQCISAMKEYENKSLEEIRLEDYNAHRNDVCLNSVTTLSGQHVVTGTTSLFGQPAIKETANLFVKPATSGTTNMSGGPSTPETTSMFGKTVATGITNIFGQPVTTRTTSMFGQPVTTRTTSMFGQPVTTRTTSMFGKPAFFGTTSVPTFGQPVINTGTTSMFGKPAFFETTSVPIVGQPMINTGTASMFGQQVPTRTKCMFGQPFTCGQPAPKFGQSVFKLPATTEGLSRTLTTTSPSTSSSTGLLGAASVSHGFAGDSGSTCEQQENDTPSAAGLLSKQVTKADEMNPSSPVDELVGSEEKEPSTSEQLTKVDKKDTSSDEDELASFNKEEEPATSEQLPKEVTKNDASFDVDELGSSNQEEEPPTLEQLTQADEKDDSSKVNDSSGEKDDSSQENDSSDERDEPLTTDEFTKEDEKDTRSRADEFGSSNEDEQP